MMMYLIWLFVVVTMTTVLDGLCNDVGCCSGIDRKCKHQTSGVFCYCDEHCVTMGDCCHDYLIVCVPGVTEVFVNNLTKKGNNRDNDDVTEITACPPFPVWLDIETNTSHTQSGQYIVYYCKQGYDFTDHQSVKSTQCTHNKWMPDIAKCYSIDVRVEESVSPIEAPGAVFIGTIAIVFLIVESVLMCLVDLPVYKKNFSLLCKKAIGWRSLNKDLHIEKAIADGIAQIKVSYIAMPMDLNHYTLHEGSNIIEMGYLDTEDGESRGITLHNQSKTEKVDRNNLRHIGAFSDNMDIIADNDTDTSSNTLYGENNTLNRGLDQSDVRPTSSLDENRDIIIHESSRRLTVSAVILDYGGYD